MQKDDVMKYVLKDEILEDDRMNESERNIHSSDSELDDED
jgi:hypothetical protein